MSKKKTTTNKKSKKQLHVQNTGLDSEHTFSILCINKTQQLPPSNLRQLLIAALKD